MLKINIAKVEQFQVIGRIRAWELHGNCCTWLKLSGDKDHES